MISLFTLLSSFLSYWGIGKLYHGKISENNKESMLGIIYTFIGVLGITCFNPIFNNFFLSLIFGICFLALSIGYISYIFLNTHPESIVVHADILDNENNKEKEIKEKNPITIDTNLIENEKSSLPIPISLSKITDLVKTKIK